MALYGVFSDLHGPYVDMRAVTLAVDVFADQGITHLIINGDFLDFYTLNAYGPKHPDVQENLETELQWGEDTLKWLKKKLPDTEIIFILGNHEHRLERFILDKCPMFYNLVSLHKQLRLKELGIKWVHYNERFQLGKSDLFIQHSPPSYSENAAATSLKKKIDQDHIWGCTHRPDSYFRTGASGKVYTSYCLGWFGDKGIINELQRAMPQNKRVFSYTKNHETWGRSFALVGVDGVGHHVQHIIMKPDYTCMVGSDIYEG